MTEKELNEKELVKVAGGTRDNSGAKVTDFALYSLYLHKWKTGILKITGLYPTQNSIRYEVYNFKDGGVVFNRESTAEAYPFAELLDTFYTENVTNNPEYTKYF